MRLVYAQTTHAAKLAKSLKKALASPDLALAYPPASLPACQNIIADMLGYRHWAEFQAACSRDPVSPSWEDRSAAEQNAWMDLLSQRLSKKTGLSKEIAAGIVEQLDPCHWARPVIAAATADEAVTSADVSNQDLAEQDLQDQHLQEQQAETEADKQAALAAAPAATEANSTMRHANTAEEQPKAAGSDATWTKNWAKHSGKRRSAREAVKMPFRPYGPMIKPTLAVAGSDTTRIASAILPQIAAAPNTSLIIDDHSAQLYALSADARRGNSALIVLNWLQEDDDNWYYRGAGFNFLSAKIMPAAGQKRDSYIDHLVDRLMNDTQQPSGADQHQQAQSQTLLCGLIHYLVVRAGDAEDQRRIPSEWRGHEPSFPMLVDWMRTEISGLYQTDWSWPNGHGLIDTDGDETTELLEQPLGLWFRRLIRDIDPQRFGPGRSARAAQDLTNALHMSEAERSACLGRIDQALQPFKNPGVKQRAARCDFTPDMLRGVLNPALTERTWLHENDQDYLDPDGDAYRDAHYDLANWVPVTLYVVSAPAEFPAVAKLTRLLYEILVSQLLLPQVPEARPNDSGFPVLFIADDLGKLPPCQAIAAIADRGETAGLSYLIGLQKEAQLNSLYGPAEAQAIRSRSRVNRLNPIASRFKKLIGLEKLTGRGRSTIELRPGQRIDRSGRIAGCDQVPIDSRPQVSWIDRDLDKIDFVEFDLDSIDLEETDLDAIAGAASEG